MKGGALLSALRRVPADIWLFVAIVLATLPFRILQTAAMRLPGIDGGYYIEVAQHVRDGFGLTSHSSLYHAGAEYFPFPTTVYPLWPLMLGLVSRVVDITVAAYWLPLVLYYTALVAAFLFGRKLWPEPFFPSVLPGFHAGHATVLLLGLQREFVIFTSLPYTEGIAWTLLFGYAWRLVTKRDSTALAWGVESGVWLGLMYLARSQFLVVPMAVAGALAIRFLTGPNRGRVALHALVTLGVTSVFIGGWFLYIRGFVHEAGISSLLRFDQNRANDLLEPMDVIVSNHGLLDLIVDRWQGVKLAWDPLAATSYTPAYFTMHWALPAALPLMAIAFVRFVRREGFGAVWARLRAPEAVPWLVLVLLATGALLSIHLAHKQYNGSWYFVKRQGLMSLPAFIFPLLWLLRQRRSLATVFGVLILSSTTVTGGIQLWTRAQETRGELRGKDRYPKTVAWLRDRGAASEKPLIVAVDGAVIQRVAWRTKDIGYHWIYGETSWADMVTLTDVLGVQYIVLRHTALDWRFFTEGGEKFDQRFARLPERPDGLVIFQRREPGVEIAEVVPPVIEPKGAPDEEMGEEELIVAPAVRLDEEAP